MPAQDENERRLGRQGPSVPILEQNLLDAIADKYRAEFLRFDPVAFQPYPYDTVGTEFHQAIEDMDLQLRQKQKPLSDFINYSVNVMLDSVSQRDLAEYGGHKNAASEARREAVTIFWVLALQKQYNPLDQNSLLHPSALNIVEVTEDVVKAVKQDSARYVREVAQVGEANATPSYILNTQRQVEVVNPLLGERLTNLAQTQGPRRLLNRTACYAAYAMLTAISRQGMRQAAR